MKSHFKFNTKFLSKIRKYLCGAPIIDNNEKDDSILETSYSEEDTSEGYYI